MGGYPDVAALLADCRAPGTGWVLPSASRSLAAVPELLLGELARVGRGVVVLAVDGLAHHVAADAWPAADVTCLTATAPSTSATGWLTAVTGVGPRVHGVPGMVHRVGDDLVFAVTGESLTRPGREPRDAVRARETVFERAAAAGARCLAAGRELDRLPGPWARAVLRGAERLAGTPTSARLAADATDPARLADAVIADVTASQAAVLPDGAPAGGARAGRGGALLWVYVNLDDHVHAHGYDDRVRDALRRLGDAALGWAADGWTVVAHSDHGQVPARPDAGLAAAWAAIDAGCALPSGGAGRLRWLHPRPGEEDAVRARLADALGDAAVVLPADALTLPAALALPTDRVGPVLAVAADERFPLPDPSLRFEHGAFEPAEMIIPWAVWRPAS